MAERAVIPFALPQESGFSELSSAQRLSANVVVDKKGVIRRRPGLMAATGIQDDVVDEAGLSAIHVTNGDAIYAISDHSALRSIYRVSGGAIALASRFLGGTGKPVIAETEAILAIAGGLRPIKTELDSFSVSILEGAPPNCTHIIAQNSRLLANDVDSRGLIWYSGQALGSSIDGHETWGQSLTSGFFSHEARPDPLVALAENTNEVFGFGSSSLQVWSPDAVSTYAPGSTREFGCLAPYSVIKREQSFYWLDAKRRFVVSDGRSNEVLSGPIQQTLDDLSTVSDAWGFWFHEGPVDCLAWVFPTERRVFAYQVGRGWAEWFGADGSNWGAFALGCVAERHYRGQRLAGTRDGRVAAISLSAQDDLGEPIVADCRTGFDNQGTESIKHVLAIWLTLRRGTTDGSTEPVAWLSYRDHPDGAWSRVAVRLGSTNDATSVVRLPGFGTYRRRQWRFEFSAPDLELVSAEQEYTVDTN